MRVTIATRGTWHHPQRWIKDPLSGHCPQPVDRRSPNPAVPVISTSTSRSGRGPTDARRGIGGGEGRPPAHDPVRIAPEDVWSSGAVKPLPLNTLTPHLYDRIVATIGWLRLPLDCLLRAVRQVGIHPSDGSVGYALTESMVGLFKTELPNRAARGAPSNRVKIVGANENLGPGPWRGRPERGPGRRPEAPARPCRPPDPLPSDQRRNPVPATSTSRVPEASRPRCDPSHRRSLFARMPSPLPSRSSAPGLFGLVGASAHCAVARAHTVPRNSQASNRRWSACRSAPRQGLPL